MTPPNPSNPIFRNAAKSVARAIGGGRVSVVFGGMLEKALVVLVSNEPTKVARKSANGGKVAVQALDERITRHAVVSRERRIRDEIRGFEAIGHRGHAGPGERCNRERSNDSR